MADISTDLAALLSLDAAIDEWYDLTSATLQRTASVGTTDPDGAGYSFVASEGPDGGAAYYNGGQIGTTGKRINLAFATQAEVGEQIRAIAWFGRIDYTPAASLRRVLDSGGVTGGWAFGWRGGSNADIQFGGSDAPAAPYDIDSAVLSPYLATWRHAVLNVPGDTTAALWIDGTLVSSLTARTNANLGNGSPIAGQIQIGSNTEASIYVRNVVISRSRALTADEIAYLYNGGAGRTFAQFQADIAALQIVPPLGVVTTKRPTTHLHHNTHRVFGQPTVASFYTGSGDLRSTSRGAYDCFAGPIDRQKGIVSIDGTVLTLGGVTPAHTKPPLGVSFGDFLAGTNLEEATTAMALSTLLVHSTDDPDDGVLVIAVGVLRTFDEGANKVTGDGYDAHAPTLADAADVYNWDHGRLAIAARVFTAAELATYSHDGSTGWWSAHTGFEAPSDRNLNNALQPEWVGRLHAPRPGDRSRVMASTVTYYSNGNTSASGDLFMVAAYFRCVDHVWQFHGLTDITPLAINNAGVGERTEGHYHNGDIVNFDDGTDRVSCRVYKGDSPSRQGIIACHTDRAYEDVFTDAGALRSAVLAGKNYYRIGTRADLSTTLFAAVNGWSATQQVIGDNSSTGANTGKQAAIQPVGSLPRRGHTLLGADENTHTVIRMTTPDLADAATWTFTDETGGLSTDFAGSAICFWIYGDPWDVDGPVVAEARVSESRRSISGVAVFSAEASQRVLFRPRNGTTFGVAYNSLRSDVTPVLWGDGFVVETASGVHSFVTPGTSRLERVERTGEAVTNLLSGTPTLGGTSSDIEFSVLTDAEAQSLGAPPCPIAGASIVRIRGTDDSIAANPAIVFSPLADAWTGGYALVATCLLGSGGERSSWALRMQNEGGSNTGVSAGEPLGVILGTGSVYGQSLADCSGQWVVQHRYLGSGTWDESDTTPTPRVRLATGGDGSSDMLFVFALVEGSALNAEPPPYGGSLAAHSWSHDVSEQIGDAGTWIAAIEVSIDGLLASRDSTDARSVSVCTFSTLAESVEVVINNDDGLSIDVGGDLSIGAPVVVSEAWLRADQRLVFVLVRRFSALSLWLVYGHRAPQQIGAWTASWELTGVASGAADGTQTAVGVSWSAAQVGVDIEDADGVAEWLAAAAGLFDVGGGASAANDAEFEAILLGVL